MVNHPIPISDDAHLDEIAREMIAEATSTTSPNVLSASGFARENISIVHQQRRAANLAWAIKRCGLLRAGDVVGIVGGSFSGMMLAVALALSLDVIVYIFEKDKRLLHRFRDKAHRHLSPVLNSRSLGKRFDPSWSIPEFRSPIFNWGPGSASDIAAAWLQEFSRYDENLPIFTFTGCKVSRGMINTRHDGVDILLSQDNIDFPGISVNMLVDATGFGDESNPFGIIDYSYWNSGHSLIYDHLLTPAKIMISGCGDSGVIEGLHYAIKDFSHRDVAALWMPYAGLEMQIDLGLEHARLESIFANEEPRRYEIKVLPEIIWWLDQRHYLYQDRNWLDVKDDESWSEIYYNIDMMLRVVYDNSGRDQPFPFADLDYLEDFILSLSSKVQYDIRNQIRPIAATWISRLTQKLAESIPLPPNFTEIAALARQDVTIVLNGHTPTPYTRQLSPYNIWMMRLLMALPGVSYRQGGLKEVVRRKDKRFTVTSSDEKTRVFDRVITRYGPGKDISSSIAQKNRNDTDEGDWMLVEPRTLVPDPNDPSASRYVDPPRAEIIVGLARMDARTGSGPKISKVEVSTQIALGANLLDPADPLYADPQNWLSAELKAGRHQDFSLDRKVIDQLNRK